MFDFHPTRIKESILTQSWKGRQTEVNDRELVKRKEAQTLTGTGVLFVFEQAEPSKRSF